MIENIKQFANEHLTLIVVIIVMISACFLYWFLFRKDRTVNKIKGGNSDYKTHKFRKPTDGLLYQCIGYSTNKITHDKKDYYLFVLNTNGIEKLKKFMGNVEFFRYSYIENHLCQSFIYDIIRNPIKKFRKSENRKNILKDYIPTTDSFDFESSLKGLNDPELIKEIVQSYADLVNNVINKIDSYFDFVTFVGQLGQFSLPNTDIDFIYSKSEQKIFESLFNKIIFSYINDSEGIRQWYKGDDIGKQIIKLCFCNELNGRIINKDDVSDKDFLNTINNEIDYLEEFVKINFKYDFLTNIIEDKIKLQKRKKIKKSQENEDEKGKKKKNVKENETITFESLNEIINFGLNLNSYCMKEEEKLKIEYKEIEILIQQSETTTRKKSKKDIKIANQTLNKNNQDIKNKINKISKDINHLNDRIDMVKDAILKMDINQLKRLKDKKARNETATNINKIPKKFEVADIYPAYKLALAVMFLITIYPNFSEYSPNEYHKMIASYVLYVNLFNTYCNVRMDKSWNDTIKNEYVYKKIVNVQPEEKKQDSMELDVDKLYILEKKTLLSHIKEINKKFKNSQFMQNCGQELDEEIKNELKNNLRITCMYFDDEIDLDELDHQDVDTIKNILIKLDAKKKITEKITNKINEPIFGPIVIQMAEQIAKQIVEPIAAEIGGSIVIPIVESITEQITESIAEPITEKITEQIANHLIVKISRPIAEQISEQIVEQNIEIITKQIAKQNVEQIVDLISEQIIKKDVGPIAERMTQKMTIKIDEQTAKQEVEQITKTLLNQLFKRLQNKIASKIVESITGLIAEQMAELIAKQIAEQIVGPILEPITEQNIESFAAQIAEPIVIKVTESIAGQMIELIFKQINKLLKEQFSEQNEMIHFYFYIIQYIKIYIKTQKEKLQFMSIEYPNFDKTHDIIKNQEHKYIYYEENKTASLIGISNDLKNVKIPNIIIKPDDQNNTEYTLIEIKRNTFLNKKLDSLEIEDNSKIKKIEKKAFNNTTIKSLFIIPESVEILEPGWCYKSDFDISISPQNKKYIKIEEQYIVEKSNNNSDFTKINLLNNTKMKNFVTIPSFINTLRPYSFSNIQNIDFCICCETVKNELIVKEKAFHGTNIGKLAFNGSMSKFKIEANAFNGANIKNLAFYGTINEDNIKENAFNGANIGSIIINGQPYNNQIKSTT